MAGASSHLPWATPRHALGTSPSLPIEPPSLPVGTRGRWEHGLIPGCHDPQLATPKLPTRRSLATQVVQLPTSRSLWALPSHQDCRSYFSKSSATTAVVVHPSTNHSSGPFGSASPSPLLEVKQIRATLRHLWNAFVMKMKFLWASLASIFVQIHCKIEPTTWESLLQTWRKKEHLSHSKSVVICLFPTLLKHCWRPFVTR